MVVVTGGFDLIHSGHINYLKEARSLGEKLIIGLNSDEFLQRKNGHVVMPFSERKSILQALSINADVISFDDSDNSARGLLESLKRSYPYAEIIFAVGSDKTEIDIPESSVRDITFKFGVGGSKLDVKWVHEVLNSPKSDPDQNDILYNTHGMKIAKISLKPGESLSMQRHTRRSEFLIVSDGDCVVNTMTTGGYLLPPKRLSTHSQFNIDIGDWYQLTNPFDIPCNLIEIQYGDVNDGDIEKK